MRIRSTALGVSEVTTQPVSTIRSAVNRPIWARTMSTPPYTRRPTTRSAAAKDDHHAFGNWLARVERPQVSRGVLLRSFDRLASNLILVRRVREDSSRQWSTTAAGSGDLDH